MFQPCKKQRVLDPAFYQRSKKHVCLPCDAEWKSCCGNKGWEPADIPHGLYPGCHQTGGRPPVPQHNPVYTEEQLVRFANLIQNDPLWYEARHNFSGASAAGNLVNASGKWNEYNEVTRQWRYMHEIGGRVDLRRDTTFNVNFKLGHYFEDRVGWSFRYVLEKRLKKIGGEWNPVMHDIGILVDQDFTRKSASIDSYSTGMPSNAFGVEGAGAPGERTVVTIGEWKAPPRKRYVRYLNKQKSESVPEFPRCYYAQVQQQVKAAHSQTLDFPPFSDVKQVSEIYLGALYIPYLVTQHGDTETGEPARARIDCSAKYWEFDLFWTRRDPVYEEWASKLCEDFFRAYDAGDPHYECQLPEGRCNKQGQYNEPEPVYKHVKRFKVPKIKDIEWLIFHTDNKTVDVIPPPHLSQADDSPNDTDEDDDSSR